VAQAAKGRTRAFVKVQSGCDNFCTYCIVPRARGRQRSESVASVLATVAERVAEGHREVVLTGVHVGAYGRDFGDGTNLAGLLRGILAGTAVERVRLSSLEPEDLTSEMLALWREGGGRLCRHFHLPLQSGCDTVLKRMGRRYRTADFAGLVDAVRREVPGAAITTDLMVGFPGETESEYAESRDFARSMAFAGIHVFKYSPRPGTPAARLPGRVAAPVAKARSDEMMALAAEGSAQFRRGFLGEQLDVLFEDEVSLNGRKYWSGLSDNYVRVYVQSERTLANEMVATRVVEPKADGLTGAIVA
jgi:threonylcarbamoyladenosine tRNA methylthiotransferase MtaB